jgi:hypothetical protein
MICVAHAKCDIQQFEQNIPKMTSETFVSIDTFSRINKHMENSRCSFSARGGQTAYVGRLDRGAGMNRR